MKCQYCTQRIWFWQRDAELLVHHRPGKSSVTHVDKLIIHEKCLTALRVNNSITIEGTTFKFLEDK